MVRRKRYRFVFLPLIAFAGSYSLFHFGFPELKNLVSGVIATEDSGFTAPHCQLSHQDCVSGEAKIKLDRDIIKPMEATKIQIEWPTLPPDADTLELTLEGQEMMMGVYRQKLVRQAGTDLFSGELVLPFCVSDEMTWQGRITPPAHSSKQPVNVSIRMIK